MRSRGTSSHCRPARRPRNSRRPKPRSSTVKDGDGEATFTGKDFSLRFDKKDGVITSYQYKAYDAAGARAASRFLARPDQ